MYNLDFIVKEILSQYAFTEIIHCPCDYQDCYDALKKVLKKYIRD